MSNEKFEFADEERAEALQLIDQLREAIADSLCEGDEQCISALSKQWKRIDSNGIYSD